MLEIHICIDDDTTLKGVRGEVNQNGKASASLLGFNLFLPGTLSKTRSKSQLCAIEINTSAL